MRRFAPLSILLIALLVTLAACGDEDEPEPQPGPQSVATATPTPGTPTDPTPTALPTPQVDRNPETQALLRVVHAAPEPSALDLYLDGALIGRGFRPGSYHTQPQPFAAGDYTLRLFVSGELPASADPLLEHPLTLNSGEARTVVIAEDSGALQVIESVEPREPLARDRTRLVAISAVPGAEPLDVRAGGQIVLDALTFGEPGGAVELPTGRVMLSFGRGGETLAQASAILNPHQVYTLLLMPDSEAGYRTVLFYTPARSETRVRAVHAAAGLPAVDIYIGARPIAAGLAYHSATAFEPIASGTVDLRVVPADRPDGPALYHQVLGLPPDRAVDLVLVSPGGQLRVVQVHEDGSPTPENAARLIFINAAAGTEQVNVQSGDTVLARVSPVSFGAASLPMLQPASRQGFSFTEAVGRSEQRLIDTLDEREWLPGVSYAVVITGYPELAPLVLETEVGTDATRLGQSGIEGNLAAARTSQVRLVHAAPALGVVTVELNGAPLFERVAPFSGTAYLPIAEARNELVVRNADGAELGRETLPASLPETFSLFVLPAAASGARLDYAPDTAGIAFGHARLRAVHAAPDAPDAQVFYTPPADPAGGTPPARQQAGWPLGFGEIGMPVDVPAGAPDLVVLAGETVVALSDASLETDVAYDLILTRDERGELAARLILAYPD